jgi:hypothetical protein
VKIKAKLSALIRIPRVTRILLAVFCVLVICVVFIGLDNAPGIILGWLATAVLLTELTRRWRKVRNFLILGFASFVGAIFLSFLHEVVVYPLAGIIGGAGALQSRALGVFHEAISLIILFFSPVGIFIGILGAITLVILRLIMLLNKRSVSSNT